MRLYPVEKRVRDEILTQHIGSETFRDELNIPTPGRENRSVGLLYADRPALVRPALFVYLSLVWLASMVRKNQWLIACHVRN